MGIFSRKKQDEPKLEETAAAPAAPTVAVPKGESARAYGALVGPHVTEKAAAGNQHGVYTFRVSDRASKVEIRDSIEKLYSVTVASVRILRMPEKSRNVGRHRGIRSGYKKAVITLKAGQHIDAA